MPEGIEVRHTESCRSHDGFRCTCQPTYRASVWSNKERRRLRRSFPTIAAAKAWRAEASTAIRAGRMRATPAPALEEAIDQWIEGAERGIIRTRGRAPFKHSTVRAVRQHFNLRLASRFGSRRLAEISHIEIQEFVDELEMQGLAPSTVEGSILPLRLVYRWARARAMVAQDPTEGIELPRKRRGTRVPPSPSEASALLAALPEEQQTIWATAMFAGLRRGELLGLLWDDVDFEAGTIHVQRSYDAELGAMVSPKSQQGFRRVPLGGSLTPYLRRHQMRTGRRAGLVFDRTATRAPRPDAIQGPADTAWKHAGLERVTLHACRHLYASMSIAAGVNAHALCKYMGHSGIQVTYDLYGHLFPGNEAEASGLLDAYLNRSFQDGR